MNFMILSILDARIAIIEETAIARRSHHNGPAKEMFFRCSGSDQVYSNRGGASYCTDIRTESLEAKRAWCKLTGITMDRLKEEVEVFVKREEDRLRLEAASDIMDMAHRAGLQVRVQYTGEGEAIDFETDSFL